MKKLFIVLAMFFCVNLVQAQPKVTDSGTPEPDISMCSGKFALCAASTCKPTGGMITSNDGQVWPEVSCTCPVLLGKAIADLTGGNMQGSCAAPMVNGKRGVWSLFAPVFNYPQEANNFVQEPKSAMDVKIQRCGGAVAAGSANCWSYSCTYDTDKINGTQTATCKCPINQIAKGTAFLTEAGQGNSKACFQNPVAAPAFVQFPIIVR